MELQRIMRKPEVIKMTGLSGTTLWRLEKEGEFPKKIQLSKRLIGWSEADIQEWIDNKKTRRGANC